MPHWILKAILQRSISILPKNQFLNHLLQKYVTKSLSIHDIWFKHKLIQCRKHLENYRNAIPSYKTSYTVLELGTGWYPITPIILYLCGASQIWTIDKVSLLNLAQVKKVLNLIVKYAEKGDLIEIIPWIDNSRLSELQRVLETINLLSPSQMLEEINIRAIICDARNTGLKASSIDLFISNSTLEHIQEDILMGIFAEFRRLASPMNIMSHFIDMRDHYVDFDSSITPYNFLKYSDFLWKLLLTNSLQYQTRLRISDYRRLHESSGFKILNQEDIRGSLEDLDKIHLAKKFTSYSKDDLLTIASLIVSTCNSEFKSAVGE